MVQGEVALDVVDDERPAPCEDLGFGGKPLSAPSWRDGGEIAKLGTVKCGLDANRPVAVPDTKKQGLGVCESLRYQGCESRAGGQSAPLQSVPKGVWVRFVRVVGTLDSFLIFAPMTMIIARATHTEFPVPAAVALTLLS